MALPDPSILSEIALQLGDAMNTGLSGKPQVRIGPPSEAKSGNSAQEPLINLFLYRFEPSGFYPEATVGDPLHMRIHCLVTAYGSQQTTSNGSGSETIIGAGEVDLRLLGAVVQHFHESPVRDIIFRRTNPVTTQEEEIRTTLQIVLQPLSSEEINQIWSTQGSAAYRASLAYELALAPITPWTPRLSAPPVDAARVEIVPPPVTTPPPPATGTSVGPALNRISDVEMTQIEQGKATPPEFPPELSFAGTTPPHRRVVRFWPASGGGFDADATSVDLTYTPHAGLVGHMLHVYRQDGADWLLTETRSIAVPGSGTATIPIAVVMAAGRWAFYVDATETGAEIPATYRSATITLEVRALTQAPGGGP